MPSSNFASVASDVVKELRNHGLLSVIRSAAADKDAEWQRVNSYIADVLKDIHVLYAKLARLQGDFIGNERQDLEEISEEVLSLGEELSQFSKAFYEGRLNMAESDVVYGNPGSGASPPAPLSLESPPAPPQPPSDDVPMKVEEEESEAPAEESQEEQG